MNVVGLAGISKRFGSVRAVGGLSLAVPEGGIFGLLGPNGAGKSTLLRIVAGLVHADSGEVRLFDGPADTAARRRIGVLIDSATFYPYLTARDFLAVVAGTSGCLVDAGDLLGQVGLAAAADRRIGGFSLGMKQRLGIAAALAGAPDLLLLDEPTNGLDPEGMAEMRRLFRELAETRGVTILLSSHLLDEVERLCDRVAIISQGRLAVQGEVSELLEERLWIRGEPLAPLLARAGPGADARDGGALIRIGRAEVPALVAGLVADGVAVHEVSWKRRDLEALFFAQTGPEVR